MNRPDLSGAHPKLPKPLPEGSWVVWHQMSCVRSVVPPSCSSALCSVPFFLLLSECLESGYKGTTKTGLSQSWALAIAVTMSESMESKTQQLDSPGEEGLGLLDLSEGGLRSSLWLGLPRL